MYDKAINIDTSILTRFKQILGIGFSSAVIYISTAIMCYIIMMLLSIITPKRSIEKAKTFNYPYYIKLLEKKYNIQQQ